MKLPIALLMVVLAIGISSPAFAGPAPASGAPGDVTTQPVISGPTSPSDGSVGGVTPPGTSSNGSYSSGTGSTGAAPAGTPNESQTDENDDTLYHGSTKDMDTVLLRDEGALHFKTKPKEKVQEVESVKNLPSSGADPKFQANLLHSGLSSIDSLGEKADEAREATDEGDPRFRTKHLTFKPAKNDQPKKAESDSTPSPTPSPTASPAAKTSSGKNQ
jgi:hypothetical protein